MSNNGYCSFHQGTVTSSTITYFFLSISIYTYIYKYAWKGITYIFAMNYESTETEPRKNGRKMHLVLDHYWAVSRVWFNWEHLPRRNFGS